ncbi:hypothetical protein ACFLTT_02235 [Chloroflexota bacterium]
MGVGEIINLILVGALAILTGSYAWQTKKQANMLERQTALIIEQRKKSITPVLRLTKFHYNDAIIWIDRKQILTPNLVVDVKNVGGGPAIDIYISIEAVIKIKSAKLEYNNVFMRLTWNTYTEHERIDLEARSSETVKLALVKTQVMKSIDFNSKMYVEWRCNNLDYDNYNEKQVITMQEGLSDKILTSYEDKLIPGDAEYPETFTPRLV